MKYAEKMPAVGTEFFADLRRRNGYYVDKTGLISELLRSPATVTLFTRPRRFGKTLNMTMLKSFFEIGMDTAIFDGLAVSEETELCVQHMGKHPVIFVTLKDIEGNDFRTACRVAANKISQEASRFGFLRTSPALTEKQKEQYEKLCSWDMDLDTLAGSLGNLCYFLEKHYGRKVVLLIDEYDVPLQKAFYHNYYDEMVQMIRSMFSQALKTNDSLELAVLTGCLRISRENIFTGMNRVSMQENPPVTGSLYNLRVLTVSDARCGSYFGFTDEEVREMLEYYGFSDRYEAVKNWYDGYQFGEAEVYCPWDVTNYVDLLLSNPMALPQNFWANSSGNDAVGEFVRRLDTRSTRQELQLLVDGECVRKEIRPELTYREMYRSVENLWSLLYMTGYLTSAGEPDGRVCALAIPNMEIRDIFVNQIMELFREETKRDGESLLKLCSALSDGDAAGVEELFNAYLKRVISIRDASVRSGYKENFYHGILLGILAYKTDWCVRSNYETGDGYGDILIETEDDAAGIVIEVKYARDGNLENGAKLALEQIENRRYAEKLYDAGAAKVLKYGIACYKKKCRVLLAQ